MVDQFVATGELSERAGWARAGNPGVVDRFRDSLDCLKVVWVRHPIDKKRPVDVASGCPLASSE